MWHWSSLLVYICFSFYNCFCATDGDVGRFYLLKPSCHVLEVEWLSHMHTHTHTPALLGICFGNTNKSNGNTYKWTSVTIKCLLMSFKTKLTPQKILWYLSCHNTLSMILLWTVNSPSHDLLRQNLLKECDYQ